MDNFTIKSTSLYTPPKNTKTPKTPLKMEVITSQINKSSRNILNQIKLLNLLSLSQDEKANLKDEITHGLKSLTSRKKTLEKTRTIGGYRNRFFSVIKNSNYTPLYPVINTNKRKGRNYKQFSMTLTNSSKGKYETSYKKTQNKKKINNNTQDNGFFLTGTNLNNIGSSTSRQNYITSAFSSGTKKYNESFYCKTLSDYRNPVRPKIRIKKKKLTLLDIRKRFPSKKYNLICKTIEDNSKNNNEITIKLMKQSSNYQQDRKINLEKKDKTQEILEEPSSTNKILSKVYNKTTGLYAIIDKVNADIITFGDNYLKLNDTDFYSRSKEIFQKYKNIRQEAKIEPDMIPPLSSRNQKINSNLFKITKKLESVQREKIKLKNMIETYNIKTIDV